MYCAIQTCPSWKTNISSVGQKICNILRNSVLHYHLHIPAITPNLTQINSTHTSYPSSLRFILMLYSHLHLEFTHGSFLQVSLPKRRALYIFHKPSLLTILKQKSKAIHLKSSVTSFPITYRHCLQPNSICITQCTWFTADKITVPHDNGTHLRQYELFADPTEVAVE